jgi:hypothetical protein
MRILFIVVLVLNLLTESLAATTLIGGPDGIAAAGKGGMWSMHYGFAALAMASVSLWIWPNRRNLKAVTAVLGVLSTFHTGLFISLTLAGDQQVGQIIHGVMAVLCIVLFTLRAQWCKNTSPQVQ